MGPYDLLTEQGHNIKVFTQTFQTEIIAII